MAVKKVSEKTVETEQQMRRRVSESVAVCYELDGTDLRVFLYLHSQLNFSEPVWVPQIEVALKLGKRKEHISRAMRRLVEAGVLLPGPKGTRASEWLINSKYGK